MCKIHRQFRIALLLITTLLCRVFIVHAQTRPAPAPKALSKALIEAVKKGNSTEVKRLLDQRANPNAREILLSKPSLAKHSPGNMPYLGAPALVLAIRQGSVDTVRLLLHKGADVNAEVETAYAPLITAVNEDNILMVKLLLAAGARPNQRNNNDYTALNFAVNRGSMQLVGLLVNAGANIEGGRGWSTLIEATESRNKELVRYLLRHGARVNPLNKGERSALEVAEDDGETEIAAILRKAGGKSRLRSLIQKEAQQREAYWGKERKQWLAEHHASALRWSEERKLTAEDKRVFETVFLDMLMDTGTELRFENKPDQVILLADETAGLPGWDSDDELNSRLDVKQANDISLDMRENLVRRNWEPVSLMPLAPLNEQIRLVDGESIDRWFNYRRQLRKLLEDNDQKASDKKAQEPPPSTKAWVHTYLPGYSKQQDKVIVWFTFGPTSHGAQGIYLLLKENGVWQVKWKHFLYFV